MDLVITIYLVIGLILSFPMLFTKADDTKHPLVIMALMFICILFWPVILAVTVVNLLVEDDDNGGE